MGRTLATLAVLLTLTACDSTGPEPPSRWDYERWTAEGEAHRQGELTFHLPTVGVNFVGRYSVGGEVGDIEGAVVGQEVQFLLLGPDSVRHVAPIAEVLAGEWAEGAEHRGQWRTTGRTGTFRATPAQ